LIHFYKRMKIIICLALLGTFFLGDTYGQEMRSTWPPIFHPGEECLAYDGSKVPDCREFIDPGTLEPYYHPHSFNCSRFWECGPTYEVCLFECANCQKVLDTNPLCKGQWALTFDPSIQYPIGPVCNWPNTIDCDNGGVPCDCLPWQSCVNDACMPQCMEDSHCPDGYICDDCNWCVVDPDNNCAGDDSNCLQGVCDVPWPYTTCEYCDTDACVPGCSTDANCPDLYPVCGAGGGNHTCGCNDDSQCPTNYICNTNDNVCEEDLGCNGDDSNCKQDICDEPANWPYTTCEYCSDDNGKDCVPGCSADGWCPDEYPICGHGGAAHRCGCNADVDCAGLGGTFICDVENHHCKEGCSDDSDCNIDDSKCDIENYPYTTCFYCNASNCVPGCSATQPEGSNCPTGWTCDNHRCEAPDGYVKLESIKVSGVSGYGSLNLTGVESANTATCNTPQLSGNGEFTGNGQLGDYMQNGCYLAPLNGNVTKGSVTGGSWNGGKLCIDWNDKSYFVVNCDIANGSLNCAKDNSVTCS